MVRNYLIVALRAFARHKLYSFINVAGLTIGLVCAIFIALFVRDELSYDAWQPGSDAVYQTATKMGIPGGLALETHSAPFPLATAMRDQIADVVAATRMGVQTGTVQIDDRQFSEKIATVDPNFFTVIRLRFLRGDGTGVLAHPESAVLTASQAKKYFGDSDPIGRTFTIDATHSVTVAAILADPPHNTQFKSAIYISNMSAAATKNDRDQWFSLSCLTFVRLARSASPTAVTEGVRQLIRRSANPHLVMQTALTGDQILQIRLVKLAQAHLDTTGSNGPGADNRAGSWTLVYGFAAIAALILAIAAFNFTNLATARASLRAREVAIRKVSGATRGQLMAQFLGESVLVGLLALILALAIVEILMPAFRTFIDRPIEYHYLSDWPLTLGIVAVAVLTGLAGGFYPAQVMSRFRPGATLKTNAGQGGGSGRLRSALVVVQFAISIGLGIAAIVVYQQVEFSRKIELGYDKDNVVVLNGLSHYTDTQRRSLETNLTSNPAIVSVSGSSTVPMSSTFQATFANPPGSSQNITSVVISVEPNFFSLYGIRLVAGRLLDARRSEDSVDPPYPSGDFPTGKNVVIDETMARHIGLTPTEAVGKSIRVGTVGHTYVRIVGVVSDAKYFGVSRSIDPTIYTYKPNMIYALSVRVRGGQMAAALDHIDRSWRAFAPDQAIDRGFLEDGFAAVTATIEKQAHMFAVFVGIAILIACLGLFGLAAFTAERRTKEIGIRKVFGASVSDIVLMLLWRFSVPVAVANLIAWPLTWLALRHWLSGFAYRIGLSALPFVAAGAVALLIAWATLSAHAVSVARRNPVEALKYE